MRFHNKEIPDDLGRKSLAWWEQKLESPGFRGEWGTGSRDSELENVR